MNKKYKLLVNLAIVLIVVFFLMILIDYTKYDSVVSSAPFSAYILIRTIEFIGPSAVLLIIAMVLKKKGK